MHSVSSKAQGCPAVSVSGHRHRATLNVPGTFLGNGSRHIHKAAISLHEAATSQQGPPIIQRLWESAAEAVNTPPISTGLSKLPFTTHPGVSRVTSTLDELGGAALSKVAEFQSKVTGLDTFYRSAAEELSAQPAVNLIVQAERNQAEAIIALFQQVLQPLAIFGDAWVLSSLWWACVGMTTYILLFMAPKQQ